MAWFGKTQATCGRPIPKPEKQGKHEEIYEEAIPIQDQIENLRAKISLKGNTSRSYFANICVLYDFRNFYHKSMLKFASAIKISTFLNFVVSRTVQQSVT